MSFVSEVIFPSDPMEATFVYYALLAYPEKDAGKEGGQGSSFATALARYTLWAASRARGLRWVRNKRKDSGFKAPHQRQFKGSLQRGSKRIHQRLVVYDLFGQRLLEGFSRAMEVGRKSLSEGKADEAFYPNPSGGPSPMRGHIIERSLPSESRVIRRSPNKWHEALRLNETRRFDSPEQQVKDLKRRAVLHSRCVLHMAHGFKMCCTEFSQHIGGWDERDPLEAMLKNGPLWIWRAIDLAEEWRTSSSGSLIGKPSPDEMVRLVRE